MPFPCRTGPMIVAVALALIVACSPESAEQGADAAARTDDQKASYGIGYNIGGGLVPVADRIDSDALLAGLEDALAEADPAVPQEEMQTLLRAFQADLQEAQRQRLAAMGEENLAEGTAFLETNAAREGVTTTESGLQYEVIEQGDGPTPDPDDQVVVHYRGTLLDDTEFDSSYQRGEPATFAVQGVIPGFSEGLQIMPVGSTYKLVIPPDIAYGERGNAGIPPNSVLIFEVELLGIVEPEE